MGFFGKTEIFDSPSKITGAHSFTIQEKNILCPFCGCSQFESGSALLNTAGMTFLNLDWANKQATILTCTKCTHIQWFLQQPTMVV